MRSTAISVSPVRSIPSVGGLGRFLSRPRVIRCLSPAPVKGNDLRGFGEDPPAPNAWQSTNSALNSLSSVVGAGTKFYIEQQQVKAAGQNAELAQSQADAARKNAALEKQIAAEQARVAGLSAPKGMPSWALPAIIGGVAILGIGAFFLLRKKSG